MAKKPASDRFKNLDTSKYSPVAAGILQGLHEALAYQRGQLTEAEGVKLYRAQQVLEDMA